MSERERELRIEAYITIAISNETSDQNTGQKNVCVCRKRTDPIITTGIMRFIIMLSSNCTEKTAYVYQ
jgi:hypothetical protein